MTMTCAPVASSIPLRMNESNSSINQSINPRSLLLPQRKSATMRVHQPKIAAVAASWLLLCNHVSALNRKEQDVDGDFIIGTGIYDM
jgi:hypothetical protein